MVVYNNATGALMDMLDAVMSTGDTLPSRNGEVKEITSVHMVIEEPQKRCIMVPKRHDNIFHKIAESMWVMAGRNDVEWLSHYLPRAVDYSDDGKTWRAAYGYRLRKHFEFDQLELCLDLLKEDPFTRRAVMVIFDPDVDFYPSKDIPCNNWIQWLIREDDFGERKLQMHVMQRSSDILWGFSGINTFEWSIMHMMMAKWLGVTVGTLTYSITSLHLCQPHWKRAEEMLRHYRHSTIYSHDITYANGFAVPFDAFDNTMERFFASEAELRERALCSETGDAFLDECLKMLAMYNEYLRFGGVNGIIYAIMNNMPDDDFKLAAYEYFSRSNGDLMRENVAMSDYLMNAYEEVLG